MKGNKAFTLVELLAVIVILGIIALIAVPIVTNIIENSKEKANDYSIEIFLKAFKNGIYEERLNDINFNPASCEVNNGVVTCNGVQLDIETSNVNGKILLQDREITYYGLNVGSSYYSIGHTDEKCFKYTTSGDSVTITKYYNNIDNDRSKAACPRDVIIPSTIDGKQVKNIGKSAFSNVANKILSVIIPNSVTYIDEYAFSSNNLTSIEIPDSVTSIGIAAFQINQLTNLIIGSGVERINMYAFSRNKLTNLVIPDNVKDILGYAFEYNNLQSVKIGSGIEFIVSGSFSNNVMTNPAYGPNQITSMVIDAHQSDVEVGTDAFSGVTGTVCWLKDDPTCGSN